MSRIFLEAAHSHAGEHEQYALEVVRRLRIYSENYIEPVPLAQDTRDTAARRDPGIQTELMDRFPANIENGDGKEGFA